MTRDLVTTEDHFVPADRLSILVKGRAMRHKSHLTLILVMSLALLGMVGPASHASNGKTATVLADTPISPLTAAFHGRVQFTPDQGNTGLQSILSGPSTSGGLAWAAPSFGGPVLCETVTMQPSGVPVSARSCNTELGVHLLGSWCEFMEGLDGSGSFSVHPDFVFPGLEVVLVDVGLVGGGTPGIAIGAGSNPDEPDLQPQVEAVFTGRWHGGFLGGAQQSGEVYGVVAFRGGTNEGWSFGQACRLPEGAESFDVTGTITLGP